MLTLLRSWLRRWRALQLRIRGVELGRPRQLGPLINVSPGVAQGRRGRIRLGSDAWLESGVVLHAFGGSIDLGHHVFLGPHTVIYGHGGVEIGDDCLIAMHCRILSSNHAIPPLGTPVRSQPDQLRPTRLGRDVWLGAGVTVLGGVTIGDGCIVGAGAVVTKDLPPGTIAFGVPAVPHGRRPAASP